MPHTPRHCDKSTFAPVPDTTVFLVDPELQSQCYGDCVGPHTQDINTIVIENVFVPLILVPLQPHMCLPTGPSNKRDPLGNDFPCGGKGEQGYQAALTTKEPNSPYHPYGSPQPWPMRSPAVFANPGLSHLSMELHRNFAAVPSLKQELLLYTIEPELMYPSQIIHSHPTISKSLYPKMSLCSLEEVTAPSHVKTSTQVYQKQFKKSRKQNSISIKELTIIFQ